MGILKSLKMMLFEPRTLKNDNKPHMVSCDEEGVEEEGLPKWISPSAYHAADEELFWAGVMKTWVIRVNDRYYMTGNLPAVN